MFEIERKLLHTHLKQPLLGRRPLTLDLPAELLPGCTRLNREKQDDSAGFSQRLRWTVYGQCGQATKGIRWMTWRAEAKKDGVTSDMLRGAGKQAVIRRFLNAATHFTAA